MNKTTYRFKIQLLNKLNKNKIKNENMHEKKKQIGVLFGV